MTRFTRWRIAPLFLVLAVISLPPAAINLTIFFTQGRGLNGAVGMFNIVVFVVIVALAIKDAREHRAFERRMAELDGASRPA